MNKRLKALTRTVTAVVCAITVCSINTIVYADDSVDVLEEQTSNLQDKLDGLNHQLTTLSSEITELATKIEETDASVQKAQLDLAAAQLSEESQYEAMKMRIKYMYEAGNASLLEMMFTADSMADFLNNTEFIRNVTEYDRNMLEELKQVHKAIEEKEATLKEEQTSLTDMKAQLEERQGSLNTAISSTSGELTASADALSAAQAAQAAAEEAMNQQQADSGSAETPNTGGSSGGNTGGGNTGGNGTITVPPSPEGTTDLVLFAAILQCEAGTSNYDSLLAVATVIMNRVSSGRYPNSINGVIYQKGQFSPTWNGSLNRVLNNGPVSLAYQVAQDALGGARLSSVSGCYSFNASYTGKPGIVVGGNVFW